MTWSDTEKSIQGATPVELYTFVSPSQTWRLTTYGTDVVFGGNTFTATTQSRSSLMCNDIASDNSDITIELPAEHPLVKAYAPGVPVASLACTIQRYHIASGVAIQIESGFASSLEFKGRMAAFRFPSGTADTLDGEIPGVCTQKLCNNLLFDPQCGIVRASFQVVTTITGISADGRTITTGASVPAVTTGSPWSQQGEILHSSSTERRSIVLQLALNQFAIQFAFPNGVPNIGDAVTIFAGCDLLVTTCRDKFSNVVNFTGFANLPTSNLFNVRMNNTKQ